MTWESESCKMILDGNPKGEFAFKASPAQLNQLRAKARCRNVLARIPVPRFASATGFCVISQKEGKMAMVNELTAEEAKDSESQLREIIEMWPHLSERVRWELFIRSWWYTVKADLKKICKDLQDLAEVVVYTLKRK